MQSSEMQSPKAQPVYPSSEKSKPLRSMTGYARTRQDTERGELTVSLRTVNHRALDFHFHQSSDLAVFENSLRALLKQYVSRGHVEVRISLARVEGQSTVEYNRDLIGRYVSAFRQAASEFGLDTQPDLNSALRLPGAFLEEGVASEIGEQFEPAIIAAVSECADELNSVREREGSQLKELLRSEAHSILKQTALMRGIRDEAVPYFQKRLTERLNELLGAVSAEPRRIAEEAAILADRSDVQEELSRLEIHTRQLLEMLEVGGEVGKKLDFLLQEMNRETNTILSKTSGIGDPGLAMTDLGLATKANIEKIREQTLNIE
jgi:uncharacterized protein (TIGR00255 family)